MHAFQSIVLVLVIAGIIVFVFSFLSMTLSFNKTGSGKYNFLSYFPFELNQFKRNSKKSWIYETLIIFSSLLLGFSLIFYLLYIHFDFRDIYQLYILMAVMFISLLSVNLLFFIKLSAYKLHLIFAIIFAFSTLLSVVLELLLLGRNDVLGLNMSTPLINIIISVVAIIFMIVLICNPSYKSWAKLVKVDAQTYNRPKYNYLAILEWGTFIVHLVSYIPLIVSFF